MLAFLLVFCYASWALLYGCLNLIRSTHLGCGMFLLWLVIIAIQYFVSFPFGLLQPFVIRGRIHHLSVSDISLLFLGHVGFLFSPKLFEIQAILCVLIHWDVMNFFMHVMPFLFNLMTLSVSNPLQHLHSIVFSSGSFFF